MPYADWSRATVLSPVELDACWERMGLGEPPWQLRLPSLGRSYPERATIVADALGALRSRGLAGPAGPVPRLAATLRMLASPEHAFDLHVRDEVARSAVGAAVVEHGVVALRHGAQVGLLALPATAVPGALIDLAGPVRPGVGHGVNVPAEVFDAARAAAGDRGLWELADALAARGLPGPDARSVARMCTGVEQLGQLGATATTSSGRSRRGPWVIGFHRTAVGHYLQLRRPGPDGRCTITIAPVDGRRLVGLLGELLTATAGYAAA